MKSAKKSLSQNFLIDKNITKKIIKETKIKDQFIIEIGPGYGFLTDFIIKEKPKNLILIEKDNDLCKKLRKKYENYSKVKIINKDVLKIKFFDFQNCTIISNLPYNISTKIILYLLNNNKNIDEMIFMIQKEVAIKFDYNLSKMNKYKFFTKLYSKYNRCFDVPPTVFKPKPKVYSTVVKFKLNKKNIDFEKAKNFSRNIFSNVRKKIKNNIKVDNLKNNTLLSKRVDQLTIQNLLYIYNFF